MDKKKFVWFKKYLLNSKIWLNEYFDKDENEKKIII